MHYLQRLLHGNLGVSLSEGVSVDSILRNALPPTLSLMIGATALWLTAGMVAGTVSALRPGSAADRVATGGVLTGLAVPTFLLALLLLWLASRLGEAGHLWFQPGYVPFSHGPGGHCDSRAGGRVGKASAPAAGRRLSPVLVYA